MINSDLFNIWNESPNSDLLKSNQQHVSLHLRNRYEKVAGFANGKATIHEPNMWFEIRS